MPQSIMNFKLEWKLPKLPIKKLISHRTRKNYLLSDILEVTNQCQLVAMPLKDMLDQLRMSLKKFGQAIQPITITREK